MVANAISSLRNALARAMHFASYGMVSPVIQVASVCSTTAAGESVPTRRRIPITAVAAETYAMARREGRCAQLGCACVWAMAIANRQSNAPPVKFANLKMGRFAVRAVTALMGSVRWDKMGRHVTAQRLHVAYAKWHRFQEIVFPHPVVQTPRTSAQIALCAKTSAMELAPAGPLQAGLPVGRHRVARTQL